MKTDISFAFFHSILLVTLYWHMSTNTRTPAELATNITCRHAGMNNELFLCVLQQHYTYGAGLQ